MVTSLDRLRSAIASRYEIECELGHGAMATVYLAKDLRHNREVAVKGLLADVGFALGPPLVVARSPERPTIQDSDRGAGLESTVRRVSGDSPLALCAASPILVRQSSSVAATSTRTPHGRWRVTAKDGLGTVISTSAFVYFGYNI